MTPLNCIRTRPPRESRNLVETVRADCKDGTLCMQVNGSRFIRRMQTTLRRPSVFVIAVAAVVVFRL